jgi:hypothetical protein
MRAELQPESDNALLQLESAAIEQRLVALIRRYVHERSASLAAAILRHIETLCQHDDYDGDPRQRCVYRRLAHHWRWLAQTGPESRGAPGTGGP